MFFSTLLSDLVLTLSSALYVPHATIETSALLKYPRCESAASRREWRTLSIDEKANWISAVNCLANLPHDDALSPTFDTAFSRIPIVNSSSSYYDDFVYMHMDLNYKIHFTGLFFPWHRWYLQVFEDSLKSKCGYRGASPYWNWALDHADVQHSPIFESHPENGLGTWGDPARDFTLQDGGFSDLSLSYPSAHILRRNFTIQPWVAINTPHLMKDPELYANTTFTQSEVRKMVDGFIGDFVGMQEYMETFQGSHANVHMMFGGDLGGQCPANAPSNCTQGQTWSANEPIFWLHHAMVDKIWSDWQNAHPSNFWSFRGGLTAAADSIEQYEANPTGTAPWLSFDDMIPADGMFGEVSIRDVMDTKGGFLCYVYE